ncbi:MAG: DUF167 domain-containing protein [Treponema sp.]|nr:DUF167 domain-containing protein [Treponema sp.]
MIEDWVREAGEEAILAIKALPGASRTALAGSQNGRLRVRIAAAPEDGKANAELASFLARLLDCPKREIELRSGEKSRLKSISIPQKKLAILLNILHNGAGGLS